MLHFLKNWRRRRRLRYATQELRRARLQQVAAHSKAKTGYDCMGCVVLQETPEELIVRVMYMTDHKPPDRAWYAIDNAGGIRELAFRDVSHFETHVWR